MAVFNKYFMNTNFIFFFLSPSVASFVGLICLNEDKNPSDKLLLCKRTRCRSNTCLNYLSREAERLARHLQMESNEATGTSLSSSPPGVCWDDAGPSKIIKGPRCKSEQVGSFNNMQKRSPAFILREASSVFFALRAHVCLWEVLS